jgi:LuxR family maltose regulon positive regulatory protein
MTTPLLTTKLNIPPVRPLRSVPSGDEGLRSVVPRPRLTERLNAGPRLDRKLTLISAPAGFGKTTLVSEWVQAMGRAPPPIAAMGGVAPPIAVAWLSLDKDDNDLARFLAYFIAALQTLALSAGGTSGVEGIKAGREHAGNIGTGALSALQSSRPPPTGAVLTSLINEIAALPDRIILLLDDYHLIEAQPVDKALTFALDHLPPQMHLVFAARSDPSLPLSRLRAGGQMTEICEADLRFSLDEINTFLDTGV